MYQSEFIAGWELQLRFQVGHHSYCRKETTQAHNNVRVTLTPKY